MLKNRPFIRAARPSHRGGFTLVELLVVIAIIGVLASVTVPAVMGGLAKAKQNVGMQNARSIALLMFQFSVDNDGSYPPYQIGTTTLPGGMTSSGAFMQLINNKYAPSADIFWLSGNPGAPHSYQGATPGTSLDATTVTWDVTGLEGASGNTGVTQSDPDQLPLVYTSGNTINFPTAVGTGGKATTNDHGGANPFKTQGIPVCYKGNNAVFKTVNDPDGLSIDNFIPPSFAPTAGVTYVQLRP